MYTTPLRAAEESERSSTRRTVVRGAVWALPVIGAAAAAPVASATQIPPNGLNGWVTISRDCGRASEFHIDGRGTFSTGGEADRGIWTFVQFGNVPVAASITFFINRNSATFTNSSEPGWSNLVRDAARDGESPAAGYFAYTTTYSGGWTWFPGPGAYSANSDPFWLWNMPNNACTAVSLYARRRITLTVGTETIIFTRGPQSV